MSNESNGPSIADGFKQRIEHAAANNIPFQIVFDGDQESLLYYTISWYDHSMQEVRLLSIEGRFPETLNYTRFSEMVDLEAAIGSQSTLNQWSWKHHD